MRMTSSHSQILNVHVLKNPWGQMHLVISLCFPTFFSGLYSISPLFHSTRFLWRVLPEILRSLFDHISLFHTFPGRPPWSVNP